MLHLLGGIVLGPEFFRGVVDRQGESFPALIDFELQFAPETADGRLFYVRDDKELEKSEFQRKYKSMWRRNIAREAATARPRPRDWSPERIDDSEGFSVFGETPLRTGVVPSHRFRLLPDTTTLLPLLLDAANFVSCNPNLKKLILKQGHRFVKCTDVDFFPLVSRVFESWYLKAGVPRSQNNTPGPNYIDNHSKVLGDATYVNFTRIH